MSRRLTTLIAVSAAVGGMLLAAPPALAEQESPQTIAESPATAGTVHEPPAEAPAVAATPVASELELADGGGTADGNADTEAAADAAAGTNPLSDGAPEAAIDATVAPETQAAPETETAPDSTSGGAVTELDAPSSTPEMDAPPLVEVQLDAAAVEEERAVAEETATVTEEETAAAVDQAAAVSLTPYPTLPAGSEQWSDAELDDASVALVLSWLEENQAVFEADPALAGEFGLIVGSMAGFLLEEDLEGLWAYLDEQFGEDQDFAWGLLLIVEEFLALGIEFPSDGDISALPIEDPAAPVPEPAVPAEPRVPTAPAVPQPLFPDEPVEDPARTPVVSVHPVAADAAPLAPPAAEELAVTGAGWSGPTAGFGAALLLAGAATVRLSARGRRADRTA